MTGTRATVSLSKLPYCLPSLRGSAYRASVQPARQYGSQTLGIWQAQIGVWAQITKTLNDKFVSLYMELLLH